MAGIKINEKDSWIAAGWAYSYAVELLLKYLPSNTVGDLKEVLNSGPKSGLGFSNLEKHEASEMKALLAAIERVISAVKSGEAAFATPEAKPEYIKRLQELRKMIARDPRISGSRPD